MKKFITVFTLLISFVAALHLFPQVFSPLVNAARVSVRSLSADLQRLQQTIITLQSEVSDLKGRPSASYTVDLKPFVLPFEVYFFDGSISSISTVRGSSQSSRQSIAPRVIDINGDGYKDVLLSHNYTNANASYSEEWIQKVWLNDGKKLHLVTSCRYKNIREYRERCAGTSPYTSD